MTRITDNFFKYISNMVLIIAVALLGVELILNFVGDKSIFKYKVYFVQSDSMKTTDFETGDLIIVKSVDATELKEGDIITFKSTDKMSDGLIITHKIRSVINGGSEFITYGTSNKSDDPIPAMAENVIGKYIFKVSKAGYIFMFLKSGYGFWICIMLPVFVIFICLMGSNIRLAKELKNKKGS